jgi:hypothetical protein
LSGVKRKQAYWWLKKVLFALLRMRHEVAYYEGPQNNSGKQFRVCHIGNGFRCEDFIGRLFGALPRRRVTGNRIVLANPESLLSAAQDCDVFIVEINRFFSDSFSRCGYFTIPEWVEFGRSVEPDPSKRYEGATKSLKSDLNRVRRSNYVVSTSRKKEDFDLFYKSMYLPHMDRRFGSQQIVKSRRHLMKLFASGFLLLLSDGQTPIAGSLVKIEGRTVTEATLGIRQGSEEILRNGVSGEIDYHLHQWSVEHDMHFINVGHTRPFPEDGIYFNKRKWMMSIMQDQDGVMNFALKLQLKDSDVMRIFKNCPFIFQNRSGLNLFHACDEQQPISVKQVKAIWKRYWTPGLNRIVGLAPNGLSQDAAVYVDEVLHRRMSFFPFLNELARDCCSRGE